MIKRSCWSGLLLVSVVSGCTPQLYKPGNHDSPFNQLSLGQSYHDMTSLLGEPDHSREQDNSGKEVAILFIPIWNIVESIGNFNPTVVHYYSYDKWGTVAIDDKNRVIRVEGK